MSTAPVFGQFAYTQGRSSFFVASSGSITAAPTAVPEPTSLALLDAGLLGLGLARASRPRRSTQA